MNYTARSIVLEKIAKSFQNDGTVCRHKIMSHLRLKLNKSAETYCFTFPLQSRDYNIVDKASDITNDVRGSIFNNITVENNAVCFHLFRDKYIKETLENKHIGRTPQLQYGYNKNVIVEFSSPNIAKPFHLGHLRSTIIGNYIANINSFLRHRVQRINYLGDWGTQIGFIQLGLNMANTDGNEIKKNPIRALYEAYVAANKLAETDPSVAVGAREIFKQLEAGDDTVCQNWGALKNCTIEELKKTYKRIGVVFDEYHWESMYNSKNTKQIIAQMEATGIMTIDEKNRKVVGLNPERNIPIIKSDGSTLYILRDVAAAIDRFQKNNFDSMYYVVDNAQTDHFSNLIHILKRMDMPWAERLVHVKFGRIRGMSTRKGTAVFLEDILNEAKEVMREKQIQSPTTKVSLDFLDDTADILGVSAVLIHDLKQKRQKDYTFDWNTIFDAKGDSGVKLQYAHCRLVNLEYNCGATLVTECDPSLLKEPEVDDLVILIGRFDEVILRSYDELEPCILTVYLFQLSNAINKAMKKLRIKGEPWDLGNQRLLLFHTAKIILAQGMRLLGLTPLDKM